MIFCSLVWVGRTLDLHLCRNLQLKWIALTLFTVHSHWYVSLVFFLFKFFISIFVAAKNVIVPCCGDN